ncbi:hydroxysteroid 11-beta-dehydrogenase 1-like protein [Exaiptasia diaphana]|uniref:Uncharacterized protein n=1 Tax=Exaiptasia diaphana TaxID=2652724 RepID=A0A913Y628_EXADI|nr:hydroxysteroid 11-beta-dehydrogenase 1-like protein [Exaiptasia diaphana]
MAVSVRFVALLGCVVFVVIAWCLRDTFDSGVLEGKKVLITGGSSGIGEELAIQYCKFGATVILIARREQQLQRVVSKCNKIKANQAVYIVADLSSLEEAKKVHSKTLELVSNIDILILNHVAQFSKNWVINNDLSKVPGHFAVNTISYINLATLFLPQLKKSNGSIIVVSSLAGTTGFAKETCYSATKHALHGFFNSLRQDLILSGHNKISITMCVLGPIDTPGKNHFKNHEKMYWYPANECALAIVKGGALKLRQMYYPYMLMKFSEFGFFYFPELFETIAQVYTYDISLPSAMYRYFRLT